MELYFISKFSLLLSVSLSLLGRPSSVVNPSACLLSACVNAVQLPIHPKSSKPTLSKTIHLWWRSRCFHVHGYCLPVGRGGAVTALARVCVADVKISENLAQSAALNVIQSHRKSSGGGPNARRDSRCADGPRPRVYFLF